MAPFTESPQGSPHARISAHEAVCAVRYGNLHDTIESIGERIDKIEGLIWVVGGTIIAGLAGLVVTVLLKLH